MPEKPSEAKAGFRTKVLGAIGAVTVAVAAGLILRAIPDATSGPVASQPTTTIAPSLAFFASSVPTSFEPPASVGSANAAPSASPSTSGFATGAVIYQTSQATGFASWAGTGQWKTAGGLLVADGSESDGLGTAFLSAPVAAPTSDYIVEAEIQFIREGPAPGIGHSFGLIVRDDETGHYAVGFGHIWNVGDGGQDELGIWLGGDSVPLGRSAYPLDGGWHTYRAEVRANKISLFVDGKSRFGATADRYLTGTAVGLWAQNSEVNIRSFEIIAP
jgi:hypothetical protein